MTSIPNKNDVILGRGRFISAHPGNVRFRSLVLQHKPQYDASTDKKAKRIIAIEIVDKIESLNPQGRFLIDSSGGRCGSIQEGVWVCVEKEKAIEKVLHRLREKSNGNLRRKSKKKLQVTSVTHNEQERTTDRGLLALVDAQSPVRHSIHASIPVVPHQPDQLLELKNASDQMIKQPFHPINPLQPFHPFQPLEQIQPTKSQNFELSPMPNVPEDISITNFPTAAPEKKHQIQENRIVFNEKIKKVDYSGEYRSQFDSASLSDDLRNPPLHHITSMDYPQTSSEVAFRRQQDSPESEEIGQRHGFDDEINAFIAKHFCANTKSTESNEQISLRQWIANSKSEDVHALSNYVTISLTIAIKITERLIQAEVDADAEKSRKSNAIPFECITAENVVLTVPTGNEVIQGLKRDESDDTFSCDMNSGSILNVEFICPVVLNPSVGTLKARLSAFGRILYELFSRGKTLNQAALETNNKSIQSLRLSCGGNSDDGLTSTIGHQSKKSSPLPAERTCAIQLGRLGIPEALISLIENLLDQDELLGYDSYASFLDVRVDLKLMLDDPHRFLYNKDISTDPSVVICDKMYGRENDISKLHIAFKRSSEGECCGAVVTGEAGIGKSTFVFSYAQSFSTNGYFIHGKFNDNNSKPFSVIGDIFDDLCDKFAFDANSDQEKNTMTMALTNSLGVEASLLADIVPKLSKLMPLCGSCTLFSVDPASRKRYLLQELLQTLSNFSKRITIFLDDVQWIDPCSLLTLTYLLENTKNNKFVTFALCCRNGDVLSSEHHFYSWLQAIPHFMLERVHLESLPLDVVNSLVSDSLRISPRLTRPLSSILHRRSLGNPFFLRQTLGMLFDDGYLYYSLGDRAWKWDLDKIYDLRLDDGVVSLLMKEMTRLPFKDLLVGLKAASCFSSSINSSIVDILSKHLGINLSSSLRKLAERGYLHEVEMHFSFSHDGIHHAAYELMTEEERRKDHMNFGLAICSHALNKGNEDTSMLFTAVNQINRGGPEVLEDPHQRSTIALLNLKVGKSSLQLTDWHSSLGFFAKGINFLNQNHWILQYELSLDLFTSAAEAACNLSDSTRVKYFTDTVLHHAKNLDDRLPALYFAVKSLRKARSLNEATTLVMGVLQQLGEDACCALDMPKVEDIKNMVQLISSMKDDSILNLKQCTEKHFVFLMKFYHELFYLFHSTTPRRLLGLSLRMITLTLSIGATDISPLAFAQFAATAVATGFSYEGYRLGKLAVKMTETMHSASAYKSNIVGITENYVSWVAEPYQALVESHNLGYQTGLRSGDMFSALLNRCLGLLTSFTSGTILTELKKSCGDYVQDLLSKNCQWFVPACANMYWLTIELSEGLDSKPAESDIPQERVIREYANRTKQNMVSLVTEINVVTRALFFQQDLTIPTNVLSGLSSEVCQLRPFNIQGVFFEGLVYFVMARRAKNPDHQSRGKNALDFLKRWDFCKWNFENKIKLLEAEHMHFLGNFDLASQLYEDAIKSSRQHKFIQEEAISHELQGMFFYKRGLCNNALASLERSVVCYRTWGAEAVANRVEIFIKNLLESSHSLSSHGTTSSKTLLRKRASKAA